MKLLPQRRADQTSQPLPGQAAHIRNQHLRQPAAAKAFR